MKIKYKKMNLTDIRIQAIDKKIEAIDKEIENSDKIIKASEKRIKAINKRIKAISPEKRIKAITSTDETNIFDIKRILDIKNKLLNISTLKN